MKDLVKTEGGTTTISGGWVTILAAIIALGPPILDRFVMTDAQKASLSVESAKVDLERAKVDLERRKAATALFQAVLANPDSAQRRMLVRFLVHGRVVDDTSAVTRLSSDSLT